MAASRLSIHTHFRKLKDPRRQHGQRHRFLEVIAIALCAVIAGADSWTDIATFGKRRLPWLRKFLALPNGIPSHDTFERLFEALDPRAFEACFRHWVLALTEALGVSHIAIDGKTLRRSTNASSGLGPLQLVCAWATREHLSLGQVAVDADSSEITAIPRLLELLDLHGALVTLDALGCQKEVARKIREGGGHYLLAVKGNQGHLLEDIQNCLIQAAEKDFAKVDWDRHQTEGYAHGRHERRSYLVIRDPEGIRDQDAWPDLTVIGVCVSERTVGGETTEEVRYFIGSQRASACYYGRALRDHWCVENCLHWQMDVSFAEDGNRTCQRRAAENLAALRRMALTLLKRHPDKGSVANKRLQAAWDTDFLEEVLRGSANARNL